MVPGYVSAELVRPVSPEDSDRLVADWKQSTADTIAYVGDDDDLPLAMASCQFAEPDPTAVPDPTATPEPTATAEPEATAEPASTPAAAGSLDELKDPNRTIPDPPPLSESTIVYCSSLSQLQSAHPYANNSDITYVYSIPGATSVSVTFDSDSYTESNYDCIDIYNGTGATPLYTYDGAEIGSRVVNVTGNTIKIRLRTDYSMTYYGFSVRSATAGGYIGVPARLTATAASATKVNVSWNSVYGASTYSLYRRNNTTGAYERVTATSATSYQDTVPSAGAYVYAVCAVQTVRGSSYVTAKSAPVRCFTRTLTLSATKSGTGARLAWAFGTGPKLYRSETSPTSGFTEIAISGNPHIDQPLSATKTYYYYLTVTVTDPIDSYVYNITSPVVAFSRGVGKPTLNNIVQVSDTSVKLLWSAAPGAPSYRVYRSSSLTGQYGYVGETTATNYTDSGIVIGKAYYYKVYGRGMIGGVMTTSPGSNAMCGYTMKRPVINYIAPNNTTKKVTIKWDAVPGATHYDVYRSAGGAGNYSRMQRVSRTSYVSGVLVAGVNYGFYVVPVRVTSAREFVGLSSSIRRQAVAIPARYRALVIGQGYAGTSNYLPGTLNDGIGMQTMLNRLTGTDYTVTRKSEQSASSILSSIGSTFSGATSKDISLFYYSGHGFSGTGSLVGTDGQPVSSTALRNKLDSVPGKKIVIIDACHSGNMIGKDGVKQAVSDTDFINTFISGFAGGSRSNLAAAGYYVIVAAHSSETSAEGTLTSGGSSLRAGYFTAALTIGCGWNYIANGATSRPADTNSDGKLTLNEVYRYTYNTALQLNDTQHAQVYPTNSSFVLFSY